MPETHHYKTHGTCSRSIDIETEGDTITHVSFAGGCNGNLQGISKLVRGKDIHEVADMLEGTPCGRRKTSCPDQLAKALREIEAERG